MQAQQVTVPTDRILTVPNALSMLRLAGVPVFLWLILGPHADGWAVALLVVSSATDYLDGYIARRSGQVSRLGQLLDPFADRLYIASTLIGLWLRSIIPGWLVLVLLARDLVLLTIVPALRRRGLWAAPVHFLGKAATFNLMIAFPLLLLGAGTTCSSTPAQVCSVLGWALAIWGTALYWWAGIMYLEQARRFVASNPLPAT